MSDFSQPASPSASSSSRSGFISNSDHSMEGWGPRSPMAFSPVHLSSSSTPSNSPRSVIVEDEEKLSPEEDPGPGVVHVQVSDSSTIHAMEKRALSIKSEYFRSYLIRFHDHNMELQEERERTVELNADFVSSEAWAVIKVYIESGELVLQDEVAFEVLQASNYLQMDKVQNMTAEYLKKLVSKSNFLTVYDFAVLRGITSLSNFITSTIIKPAEVVRRRKYGAFDLNLQIGQLVFKCHWSVLSSMSQRIKAVLGDKRMNHMIDSSSFGITCENSQLFYNVFELVYLGREEFSIYSFEEGISVFKILQSLKFDRKFIQSCLTELSRLVTLSNFRELYSVGVELSHDGPKNIALYLLMHKIEQLKTSEFFLGLPCEDCCKILSHSMLNVPSEFSVVELILDWLKNKEVDTPMVQIESMALKMFECVRWGKLSKAEMEYLKSKELVQNSQSIQTFLRSHINEKAESKARGWPRLLVLVEGYGGLAPLDQMCSVQSYDSETKQWSTLTKVPITDQKVDAGSDFYGVTSVQNNLVLTWSNNSVPYIPVAVQTYDIWSDSWSKTPCLVEDAINKSQHSTVEVREKVYTVIVPKKKKSNINTNTMCLHMMSGVLTDSPLWSVASQSTSQTCQTVPQLASTGDLVHMIGYRGSLVHGRLSLDTYNPMTQTWAGSWLRDSDDVADSAWVGWGGGLAKVGGYFKEQGMASNKFEVFPLEGGEGKSFASMVKERIGPGLMEYKGMLFAAGGRTVKMVSNESGKRRKKQKKVPEAFVEDTVEYYVPELDCWNLMRTQPKIAYSNVSMVVVDKPVRLMSREFTVKKGVKRPLLE